MADNTGYAPLGKTGIRPRGAWVIGITYERLDAVTHNQNLYLALKDNAVEPSDDGENWMLLLEGVPIATEDTLGKVKPDGSTITVDKDGTMHVTPQVPESVLFTDDEEPTVEETEELPRDADMLNGELPEYYANAIIDYCKQKVAGVKRIIYPITKTKAVYDDNGTRLDNKLTAMQEQLDGVSTEIGTTIDEAITQRAGEDIATKEEVNKIVSGDTVVANADTLDGKHASEFLPLAGGILNGDLGISELGDTTSTSYLFCSKGTTYLGSGNNLTGKKRQISILPKVLTDDFRYGLRYDFYEDNAWQSETILHTGNSNPIVKSTTAPSDTTALWYNQSTKTLKSYVDGAWT